MAGSIKHPRRFYVYILYRDIEMTDPFWVGAGSDKRYRIHNGRKGKCGEICRQLKATIGFVPSRKVWRHLARPVALRIERALIKHIGREPDGPLVNISPNAGGGHYERKPGYSPSAETRQKIAAANRGQKRSLEARARMSAAVRPPFSDETKRKLSIAAKRQWGRQRAC